MTAATIALFWALAAWALVGRDGRRLVCGFFASLPFMSFAVVPVDFLGGLSLTPAPVLGTLLVLRTALAGRGARVMLTDALLPRRMLLLTLFWAVAVVITLFMPAILAGRVLVIPVRAAWMGPVPLFPSAQNLSQLGYLTVSVLLALAFAVILREPEGRRRAFGALCLGGWVAVATGLLDYASLRLPLEAVLAPFRTASYALLVSDQALGGKRVVGLMPEASSFGLLCLGFLSLLCFLRRGLDGERRAGLPVLLGLLAVCVWLSTSSAAYVGLALLGIVLAVDWVWRAAGLRRGAPGRHGLAGEAWVAGGALAAVMLVLVVFPAGPERLVAGFDAMVLQKPGSSSYLERSQWTATSWRALLASGELGVGVGSTRASSSIVAVAAGTGLLGAALYLGFVAQTLARRARPGDAEGALLLGGLRWALLPPFAVDLMIGSGADFGPFLAFLFGLGVAACAPEPAAEPEDVPDEAEPAAG